MSEHEPIAAVTTHKTDTFTRLFISSLVPSWCVHTGVFRSFQQISYSCNVLVVLDPDHDSACVWYRYEVGVVVTNMKSQWRFNQSKTLDIRDLHPVTRLKI